jgi:hypothetical protein
MNLKNLTSHQPALSNVLQENHMRVVDNLVIIEQTILIFVVSMISNILIMRHEFSSDLIFNNNLKLHFRRY